MPPPVGVCTVAVIALVVWISTADQGGLQVLLVILKAGGGAGIIVLLLLLLLLVSAVVPALGEMDPRSFRTERGCPVAVEESTARAGGVQGLLPCHVPVNPRRPRFRQGGHKPDRPGRRGV